MEKEKDLIVKDPDPMVNCPIHGESNHLTYLYDGKVWGERLCFHCVAEVMNDLVVAKQKRFIEHQSNE